MVLWCTSGRLLRMDSTSVRRHSSSSCLIGSVRQSFSVVSSWPGHQLPTNHKSVVPGLEWNSTVCFALTWAERSCFLVVDNDRSFLISLSSLLPPIKFEPLSEYMLEGVPHRLQNLLSLAINSSVSSVLQTSMCMARVLRHTNRQVQALWLTGLWVEPTLSLNQPAKSMPTWLKAVASGVVLAVRRQSGRPGDVLMVSLSSSSSG